jgi:hypothetical protein
LCLCQDIFLTTGETEAETHNLLLLLLLLHQAHTFTSAAVCAHRDSWLLQAKLARPTNALLLFLLLLPLLLLQLHIPACTRLCQRPPARAH